jgi:hypothetical protein
VTILFSPADQNRYRDEVMGLVWVVVGASAVRALRVGLRLRRVRARSRV